MARQAQLRLTSAPPRESDDIMREAEPRMLTDGIYGQRVSDLQTRRRSRSGSRLQRLWTMTAVVAVALLTSWTIVAFAPRCTGQHIERIAGAVDLFGCR